MLPNLGDKSLIPLKSLGGLPLISKEPRFHPKGLAHGGQWLWMSLFTEQSELMGACSFPCLSPALLHCGFIHCLGLKFRCCVGSTL